MLLKLVRNAPGVAGNEPPVLNTMPPEYMLPALS